MLRALHKSSPSGVLENFSNTFAGTSGTFEVLLSSDLLCNGSALVRGVISSVLWR